MDPHMTKEAFNKMYLGPLTHRYLKQTIPPPSVPPPKKKKLVNFKISRRRRSVDEHAPVRYNSIPDRKVNGRNQRMREDVEEDRIRENEDVANFNHIHNAPKREDSDCSLSTQESVITPEGNGNIPSGWPQIPDNQRPNLNKMTLPLTSVLKSQKKTECLPLKTRQPSQSSSWEKLKSRSSTDTIRRESLFSIVNNAVNKRTARPAPSIWTPSIPRSQPTPRPGNWREQEEPGSGSYLFSFISNALVTKSKQQMKQMRFQNSSYYQESQSPMQRRKCVEFYGKQYKQWVTDILRHPGFHGGNLMKAIEVGDEYPVLHMAPVSSNANSKRHDSFTSSTHLGLGSNAILSQGVYQEVVSWVPELLVSSSSDPAQWARCFIVIAFKTLDGDFSRVEDQWREWTGALHVYFNIADDLHLKKLSFFRRISPHHINLFTYIVVIEVDTVTKENCLYLLDFVCRMRMKGMGGYLCVYQEHLVAPSSSKSKTDSNPKESPMRSDDSSVLDMNKIKL